MGEDEQPRRPQQPNLSSDAALDRLLRRLGPLLRWQEYEDRGAPEEEQPQPDPAFERRLRARLTAGEEEAEEAAAPATPARRGRWPVQGGVALRVGLAAAALAVVILVAVAVVEVGVVTAITAALALVAVAVVLVVRARLGQ